MTDVLLASISTDSTLTAYAIQADGQLALLTATPAGGSPGPLALSPDGHHLYACLNRDGRFLVGSFRIGDGFGLEKTGDTDMGANPCHLYVDRTGRFLLGAYYSDGMVTVDPIGADGALGGERVQCVKTADNAHYIQTDAANRFAFVPHVRDANAIHQFLFDEQTGELTPNAVPQAPGGSGEGPRHFCFHPSGKFAFTDGEQGSCVTVWDYDAGAGTLSPRQTLSTLPPEGFAEVNTCSQIHITPNGRFVYAGNRGHHSLAGFHIDDDGSLTALGQFPADPNPRPFAISPDGGWLYAGGSSSEGGRLLVYRITGSGALKRQMEYPTGDISWVVATRR